MMQFALGIAAGLALNVMPPQAQTADDAWRELARIDAEAALALIKGSHPGAAPDLGDLEFQERLRTAQKNVATRLPLVADYNGHAALLSGLANDFGDGHIWSNARLAAQRRTWAGMVMMRRAQAWMVASHDTVDGETALDGARLVQCDGIPADRLGDERVGRFYADARVEADLASNAYRLLLDDGNPFLRRPVKCEFQKGADKVTVSLNWRPIGIRQLEEAVTKAVVPAQARIGITAFEGGQWIELGGLGNEAQEAINQVKTKLDVLREAPMVVLDLRGNSGGNSAYADEIARLLVGETRWAAANFAMPECSGQFWRVSDGNIAALEEFVSNLPSERRGPWQAQLEGMRAAKAGNRPFSPDLPECARSVKPAHRPTPESPPASSMRGRLVLVTDRSCFSSCLIAADLFRSLGALHVGEATDRSTRYMEVREIILPSGLRTFSTLQKASVGMADFGPYEPQISYPGPLADLDALKAWVAKLPAR